MTEVVKVVQKQLTFNKQNTAGQRVVHVHKCGHECDSSYCEDPRDMDCENCGGLPYIHKGREPWRGR